MLIRSFGIALLFTFLSGSALAAEPKTSRIYKLPDGSQLEFMAPQDWNDNFRQPPKGLPPTITLAPATGLKIKALVTVGGFSPRHNTAMDDERVRKIVLKTADETKLQAVESTLPLKEIVGVSGKGYYFTATDKAPKPDEYKYLNQGVLRLDEGTLIFTLLSNDGGEAELAAAFELLKTAKHSAGPVPTAASAPAPKVVSTKPAEDLNAAAGKPHAKYAGADLRACLAKTDNRAVMACVGPVR